MDREIRNLPTFTNQVVIIKPKNFFLNQEANLDNKFMKNSGLTNEDTQKVAVEEFE